MTRWDWKSILGYFPLATGLYTPKALRARAERKGVKGTPYAEVLIAVARKVEDGVMTPWEAQRFVHEARGKYGVAT